MRRPSFVLKPHLMQIKALGARGAVQPGQGRVLAACFVRPISLRALSDNPNARSSSPTPIPDDDGLAGLGAGFAAGLGAGFAVVLGLDCAAGFGAVLAAWAPGLAGL